MKALALILGVDSIDIFWIFFQDKFSTFCAVPLCSNQERAHSIFINPIICRSLVQQLFNLIKSFFAFIRLPSKMIFDSQCYILKNRKHGITSVKVEYGLDNPYLMCSKLNYRHKQRSSLPVVCQKKHNHKASCLVFH